MLCINPYRKPSAEFGCGQCICCRVNRKRTWTARICLESLACRESSFVTLTYSDEHLPASGSLSKAHWREFTNGIGYRYFGCGEYGERLSRPHYHLVLFGIGAVEAEQLAGERWRYGFVCVRPFAFEHASYVASYTVKKLSRSSDPRLAPGQIPEFALMSRRPGVGVPGLSWMSNYLTTREGCKYLAEALDVPQSVRVNGSVYPLGRTLVRHLRDSCDIPADVPLRTVRRENLFRSQRLVPELRVAIERKRVSRYERLRALSRRPRGVL